MCGVLVFVFATGRFDGEVAFLLVFDQFDVFIFDVYDGRFFILTEEIVLFLVVFNSSERLNRRVIEINRTEICVALVPVFQMLFQQQIISCGDMIVLVGFDATLGVLNIKIKLFEFLQDVLVDRNAMKSNHNPAVQGDTFTLFTPFMTVNLLQSISFGWVYVEDFLKQVSELLRHKLRKHVLTRQNLLVELGGVTVFEGQISTDHCE